MTEHPHDLPDLAAHRAHVTALDYVDAQDADGVARLRDHLRNDHGIPTYEDDEPATMLDMHDGQHRRMPAPPPAPAEPAVPEGVLVARAEAEAYRLSMAEKAYDVETPTTLRERMAYARSLAASGLVPKAFRSSRPGDDGFRETAANIVLATELGRTLGLSPLQALCQVNVVEGKPTLGAEGQLAQVLQAGHDIYVDDSSDRAQGVVVCRRLLTYEDDANGNARPVYGREHRIVYTLDDAVAAGLCRIVDGKPFARSSQGKPLPWETSTPDMLVWRAVTRACKRVFPDVTGGLAAVDDEPGTQYARGGAATAGEAPAPPARAQRPERAVDTVEADLALFTDATGPWWRHAEANVRRRNKLQLAADRLLEARTDGDARVPAPSEAWGSGADEDREPDSIVDAEVVEDPAPDPVAEAVVDIGHEAQELERTLAGAGEPASPAEDVLNDADLGADAGLPAPGAPPVEPVAAPAEDVPLFADDSIYPASAPEDVHLPPPALDRDQLWDAVEALAAERGKTTTQLLARHTLAVRKAPSDMDADDLQAFLDAQRGL